MAKLVDKTVIVVFGSQLLKNHPALEKYPQASVLMIEADNLFMKLPYHKHKMILILASMRNYRDLLISQKRSLIYVELAKNSNFKQILTKTIKSQKFSKVVWMTSSDKNANTILENIAIKMSLQHDQLENAQFLTPVLALKQWFENKNNPIMDSFYRWQRQRLGILLDGKKPTGGKWSYDHLNRQPLPAKIKIPVLPTVKTANHQVAGQIISHFYPKNTGNSEDFWLPTTHSEAESWLKDFIALRLSDFGPYEDAMCTGQAFLFHSVLSPLLNIGLLTPQSVLDEATKAYQKGSVSINSYEGFIRQIIGWREYMNGLYICHQSQLESNFFGFTKKLEPWWYGGEVPQDLDLPVKEALKSTFKYGYNHHIERLMILGNWFLLNSYDPNEVYKWFSSMYVDAYDWVMVPNVYGMSQYADGGLTATKPYISGGNYLQKMGKWWPNLKAAQDSGFTRLYWEFLDKNQDKFSKNPRMSLALALAKKRKA